MSFNPFRRHPNDGITPAEAKKRYDADVLFIDVREPEEHAEVRIPGSILIPLSELNQRITEIPAQGEVVIYCRSGNRSRQVVDAFREQLGYSNLLNLEGGIIAWYESGYPLDTQPMSATYAATPYEEIDVAEAKKRLATNHCLLIDVREPFEFAGGHVPGARNIPLNNLPDHVDELRSAESILLVCNTGNRSGMAAEWLKKQGLDRVINIEGGTVDWLHHGFPIER